MHANMIAEGVFDELNQVLNNMSEKVNFDQHFDVGMEPAIEKPAASGERESSSPETLKHGKAL
jgi:hypothetical protein